MASRVVPGPSAWTSIESSAVAGDPGRERPGGASRPWLVRATRQNQPRCRRRSGRGDAVLTGGPEYDRNRANCIGSTAGAADTPVRQPVTERPESGGKLRLDTEYSIEQINL